MYPKDFKFPPFEEFSEGTGVIRIDGFKKGLKASGYFPKDNADSYYDMAFFVANQDGNGGLTFNEYEIMKTAAWRMLKFDQTLSLKHFIFALIDADCSGRIDASEMRRLVEYWGRSGDMDNCRAHVKYFDADNDGCLDFEEFIRVWG